MREPIQKTWGWDEAWQRADFSRRFEQGAVSIIEVDGRPAGSLWLESRPDSIYISNFQVLPELQRRGVGTAVLHEVIAQATASGVAVELSVLQVNPDAQRLYERLGFAVTGHDGPFVRMRRETSPPRAG